MRVKNKQSFSPLTVIVTRPLHQAQPLCHSIKRLGAQVVSLPTIEIKPIDLTEKVILLGQRIKPQDIAIFVSANAVIYSQHFWKGLPTLPKLFAIGPGTAHALQMASLPLTAIPGEYSSEGLLTLPQLTQIYGKTIYICSGTESRPLLAETLKMRGANVIPIICYQRFCPLLNTEALKDLDPSQTTISIITSKEGLTNYYKMIHQAKFDWLLSQPILVSHATQREVAKNLGFEKIITAHNPTDTEIITTLIRHNYFIGEKNE